MDEELKSAVKLVFICDPAAVTTAGGQHTVPFIAVTLMIRRGFQTLSVLKFLRFLSVCAHAEVQNNAATVMNENTSQQDELTPTGTHTTQNTLGVRK